MERTTRQRSKRRADHGKNGSESTFVGLPSPYSDTTPARRLTPKICRPRPSKRKKCEGPQADEGSSGSESHNSEKMDNFNKESIAATTGILEAVLESDNGIVSRTDRDKFCDSEDVGEDAYTDDKCDMGKENGEGANSSQDGSVCSRNTSIPKDVIKQCDSTIVEAPHPTFDQDEYQLKEVNHVIDETPEVERSNRSDETEVVCDADADEFHDAHEFTDSNEKGLDTENLGSELSSEPTKCCIV